MIKLNPDLHKLACESKEKRGTDYNIKGTNYVMCFLENRALTAVVLLIDVFENFREICMKHYGLDLAHYYPAPGLAYDAALKFSDIELELLTDPDMLLKVEKGIRGGLTMASQRYA